MQYLEGLNEAQKEAVLATEGPVLVLAGAGAGKTRTIAHRILHLVNTGVHANHILAITFTNKSAREMRERVYMLLSHAQPSSQGRGGAMVSTFHALSVQILREHAAVLGLHPHFSIFDRADSLRAMKHAIRAAGEDEKRMEPRLVLGTISRAKGEAKTQTIYREEAGNEYYPMLVSEIWGHYEKTLRKEKSLDFDDLLLETWRLLTTHPDVRQKLQERWQYLHVDEYQDTNKVQYEIVRLLAGKRANLFCVGDLDQNVYTWRGSTIENILKFEEHFPHAKLVKLEENYRSTKTIVHVSNEIIKKNRRRKEKTLFTNNKEGEKLSVMVGYDERDEADKVAANVQNLLQTGSAPTSIAVLYRANFQSRALEDAFLAAGIPYKVLGTRFFDRKEVKDVLTYVRTALNPDSEYDIQRIINVPTRGIGKVTVDRLLTAGRDALTGTAREKVEEFYRILRDIRARAETEPASATLSYAIERSGLGRAYSDQNEEDRERLENMKELVSLATARYDSDSSPQGVLRLLEDAALATDQDELDQKTQSTTAAVTLMTVHASKGLEYKHVFITGLEDGLFPHEHTDVRADDEEERRLFYVALTRAEEQIHLSYAQMRTIFGARTARVPSVFLLDIDEEYLETDEVPQMKRKVIYLE